MYRLDDFSVFLLEACCCPPFLTYAEHCRRFHTLRAFSMLAVDTKFTL